MNVDPFGIFRPTTPTCREKRVRPALRLFAGVALLIALLRPDAAPALGRQDCMRNPMFCSALIKDDPNDIDLRLLRAAGYQAQKEWDKAVDDYSAAIALDPDDADLYFRRGRAREAAGRLSDAHADYLDALKLDPNRMEYALAAQRSICSPQDFDRVLNIDARSADAYLIAGLCSQRTDHMGTVDLDRAEKAETRAIALKPDFAAAYYNRALLYVTKRNYGRALADLDSLERIDPDNADVYTLRGVMRGAQGDLGGAVREHGKAIVADPLGARRYLYRAWALFNAGQANAALADAKRAVMLAPGIASTYETKGRIELALGDKTGADLDFQLARLPDSMRIDLAKPSSGPPADKMALGPLAWLEAVAGIVGLAIFMFLGQRAAGRPPAATPSTAQAPLPPAPPAHTTGTVVASRTPEPSAPAGSPPAPHVEEDEHDPESASTDDSATVFVSSDEMSNIWRDDPEFASSVDLIAPHDGPVNPFQWQGIGDRGGSSPQHAPLPPAPPANATGTVVADETPEPSAPAGSPPAPHVEEDEHDPASARTDDSAMVLVTPDEMSNIWRDDPEFASSVDLIAPHDGPANPFQWQGIGDPGGPSPQPEGALTDPVPLPTSAPLQTATEVEHQPISSAAREPTTRRFSTAGLYTFVGISLVGGGVVLVNQEYSRLSEDAAILEVRACTARENCDLPSCTIDYRMAYPEGRYRNEIEKIEKNRTDRCVTPLKAPPPVTVAPNSGPTTGSPIFPCVSFYEAGRWRNCQ